MQGRATLAPDQYVFSIICDHNLDMVMCIENHTNNSNCGSISTCIINMCRYVKYTYAFLCFSMYLHIFILINADV